MQVLDLEDYLQSYERLRNTAVLVIIK